MSTSSFLSLVLILRIFIARFLSCVYSLRSQVRSDVHHFLAYGDGLTFGVSVCTASETTNVSIEYAGVGVRCQLSGYRLSGYGLGLWLFRAAKVAYYGAIFSLFSSS